MAERIQLKEPGSEFVMAVSKVATEIVEGIEYFLFTNGQKELLVPKTSVNSQIERLGADSPADIAGKTVKFSRSTKLSKYGKAFWNLDLASGAENGVGGEARSQSQSASVSATPPSTPSDPSEKPRLDRLYLRATRLIIDEVMPLYAKAGIGLSDAAVAAMAATVFIAASKVEAQ